MSDLVSAQKEFEELIDQLEKLKTVNQITASNAENAEKLIAEVEAFSAKAGSYIEKVHAEQEQIGQQVSKVVSALESGIAEYRAVNSESREFLESSLSKLTELMNRNFTSMAEALKVVKGEQKKSEQNLKGEIDATKELITEFQSAHKTEMAFRKKEINTLKIILIVTLVLMLAGFGGIIWLMVNG